MTSVPAAAESDSRTATDTERWNRSSSVPTTCRRRSSSSRSIFDLPKKGQRLDALQRELADPNIWQDPQRAQRLAQESKGLREEVQVWRKLEARVRDIIGLAELAIAEDDGHLQSTLEQDLGALDADVGKQEVDLLFANPYAEHPALVSIHAGAGGTDSQDWTEMLLRMYLRWAERRKLPSEH